MKKVTCAVLAAILAHACLSFNVEATEAKNTYNDDVKLIALFTIAEGEDEPEKAQRLIIDTILNRKDSEDFPNTYSGVLYQKGQFSVATNGRLNRCTIDDDICDLVEEEMEERTNDEVLYFRAGHYHNFGTPITYSGDTYFSK
jgi:N-acetylmuramoyl-L-alanine amidase